MTTREAAAAFVALVEAGEIVVMAGREEDGDLISYERTLTLADEPRALTAEAFQHGSFGPEVGWDEAEAAITTAMVEAKG